VDNLHPRSSIQVAATLGIVLQVPPNTHQEATGQQVLTATTTTPQTTTTQAIRLPAAILALVVRTRHPTASIAEVPHPQTLIALKMLAQDLSRQLSPMLP
jgi:hypothetical protein